MTATKKTKKNVATCAEMFIEFKPCFVLHVLNAEMNIKAFSCKS